LVHTMSPGDTALADVSGPSPRSTASAEQAIARLAPHNMRGQLIINLLPMVSVRARLSRDASIELTQCTQPAGVDTRRMRLEEAPRGLAGAPLACQAVRHDARRAALFAEVSPRLAGFELSEQRVRQCRVGVAQCTIDAFEQR